MTGNPCTDYENYRDFVIATLPQLKVRIQNKNLNFLYFLNPSFNFSKTLDGVSITKTERIKALQVSYLITNFFCLESYHVQLCDFNLKNFKEATKKILKAQEKYYEKRVRSTTTKKLFNLTIGLKLLCRLNKKQNMKLDVRLDWTKIQTSKPACKLTLFCFNSLFNKYFLTHRYWNEPTDYTPESRLETHKLNEERKKNDEKSKKRCTQIF